MKKKLAIVTGLALVPFLASAQTNCAALGSGATASNGTLFNVLCTISKFLNAVVPVIIALAVVFFVFGVVTYVIADDEEAKTKGRDRMIYGIIGLAVIVGLWGLVNILGRTFGVGSGQNPNGVTLPGIDVPSSNY